MSPTEPVKQIVEKGSSPIIGNAFAYFLIVYAIRKGWLLDSDAKEAIAFGGAIVTWLALYFRNMFGGVVTFVKWCIVTLKKE